MIHKLAKRLASAALATGLFAMPAFAQDVAKVRIGYMLTETTALQLLVGRDDGIFKANNVDIELTRFDNGTQMTQALVGGSLDGALAGAAVVSSIAVRGLGVLICPTYLEYDTNLIYATKDSGIKSVADLKGKRVAYPFGTTAHVLVANALKKDNLQPSDINSVNMNYQATMTALLSGAVPAAVITANVLDKAAAGGAVRVVSLRDFYPDTAVLGGLVMANDYVKNHKDALPRIAAGLIEAQVKLGDEKTLKKVYNDYFAKFESFEIFNTVFDTTKFPTAAEWNASFKEGRVANWALATAKILKDAGTIDRIGEPTAFLAPDVYLKGSELAKAKK
jgi:NitT/TauT family transport system substrate-binding protein